MNLRNSWQSFYILFLIIYLSINRNRTVSSIIMPYSKIVAMRYAIHCLNKVHRLCWHKKTTKISEFSLLFRTFAAYFFKSR